MKKSVAIAFLVLFGTVMYAQPKQWTLEEAVAYALQNNISVKQSELDIEMAKLDKNDALANFFPNLNANTTFASNTGASINPTTNLFETTTFSSFTVGIQSGVNLFDGLRNVRQYQRAKLAQVASQYNLGKMKDDIALFVANAYLEVLFNKENLKILKAQNQITIEQLERTNALVDAGVLPRGDLLEIKSTDASEKQRIIVAENSIRIALVSLAQTLLIKDYENFNIVDSEYEIPLSDVMNQPVSSIVQKAREERFETKIADQNLEIAEKDLQLARGAYFPTLTAFLGVDSRWADNDFFQRGFWTQLDDNRGTGFGFRASIPIFNGFAVRNNVKRSKIGIERAELQKEQADLDLEANVYRAYTDVQGAFSAYEAAIVAEEAQQLAFEFTEERFNVGFLNSFDFSQAKIRLENAQSEVLRAKYDYIFKLKVLELYFGVALYER
jgi:outer membrane protein